MYMIKSRNMVETNTKLEFIKNLKFIFSICLEPQINHVTRPHCHVARPRSVKKTKQKIFPQPSFEPGSFNPTGNSLTMKAAVWL